eukprot:PhF_6_TR40698/c1_g2_i2/m.61181
MTDRHRMANMLQHMQEATNAKDYMTAYDIAKKTYMDFPHNTTVMWRYAEAINNYMETKPNDKENRQARLKLLDEGMRVLDKCIDSKMEDGQCYSWRAVLGSKWGDMQSLTEKIKNTYKIKEYAERATELIPNDGTAQHVAGAFHYHVANISWMERKVASTLFATPPTAKFEDAAKHLEKAHVLTPNFIRNALMLGDCYQKLGQGEVAKGWYRKCTEMTPTMHIESEQLKECGEKLKKI